MRTQRACHAQVPDIFDSVRAHNWGFSAEYARGQPWTSLVKELDGKGTKEP